MTKPTPPAKAAKSSGALAALKGRTKRTPASGAEPPPELPERHETVAKSLRRQHPFLFDPREMPTVLEMSGPAPVGDHSEYYVTALIDGHRQVTPMGCTTPTVKTMWTKGQHVRRDIYATYVAELPEEQRAAALGEPVVTEAAEAAEAAEIAELPEPPPPAEPGPTPEEPTP